MQLKDVEYGCCSVELNYDNWTAEEILKAVLPEDIPSVTGFSIVGHVAHLNLKETHSPYKTLIGRCEYSEDYTIYYRVATISCLGYNMEQAGRKYLRIATSFKLTTFQKGDHPLPHPCLYCSNLSQQARSCR